MHKFTYLDGIIKSRDKRNIQNFNFVFICGFWQIFENTLNEFCLKHAKLGTVFSTAPYSICKYLYIYFQWLHCYAITCLCTKPPITLITKTLCWSFCMLQTDYNNSTSLVNIPPVGGMNLADGQYKSENKMFLICKKCKPMVIRHEHLFLVHETLYLSKLLFSGEP